METHAFRLRANAPEGQKRFPISISGPSRTFGGTRVAAPLVTGAIALLWSEFPTATAALIKFAVAHASEPRRASVVPPVLNAAMAYEILLTWEERRWSLSCQANPR
jgi:subtilisin family serine protease